MKTKFKNLAHTILTKINALLPFFLVYFIYALTAFPTVQTEDSGELIASAVALDVAHPPGYPVFTLIGKLFSLLVPFGNMAWRINIMSAFFGALTAYVLYVIIKKRSGNDLIAFGMSLFYAFSNIIWGQSNRAEVYTLNTFFIVLIMYLLLRWHEDQKSKWLYLTALSFGLGVGNHHSILLAIPAIFIYVVIKNRSTIINPKIVLGCLGLLAVGLSFYAYIPIRTYIAPYDNPAYIDHSGLYTWDKFIGFVNRKIYGGTVSVDGGSTADLNLFVVIKNFAANYGGRLINNNAESLLPLLKFISNNFYYIPLFLFLPGLYFLFKKDPQWGALLAMLFVCFTVILNVFTPIDSDIHDIVAFGVEPFTMPAIIILTIICAAGLHWAEQQFKNKKALAAFGILCLVPAGFALAKNYTANNESKNFVAYDFNKLALESLPQNAYLISSGKDNMTFPLYYLTKVEKVRPDVHVEIFYSSGSIDESYLQNAVAKNNGDPVYMDLLPPNYGVLNIKPYNFVYQYGGTGKEGKEQGPVIEQPLIRGLRTTMDYPDTRLKMLYYLKVGIMEKDKTLQKKAFDQVLSAPGNNSNYINVIGDYAYFMHDYELAKKAYEKSNNSYGLQKTNDAINNPAHMEDTPSQAGMS